MELTQIRVNDNNLFLDDLSQAENAAIARTQAEIYGFLATVFNRQPTADFVKTLRGSAVQFLKDLSNDTNAPSEISLGWREIIAFVDASVEKSDTELQEELAVDWVRLFRAVGPQYGPTPPYEGVYVNTENKGATLLSTLIKFYRESGVVIEEEYRDRPDYIGLELSFLCYMTKIETQAWENGNIELARSCQETERLFIDEHLGLWAHTFLGAAMDYADTGFYKGFLHLCFGFIPKAPEKNS